MVDQVVSLRQINDRARAVAAQAAIVMTQAMRASQAVSQATAKGAGPGDRDTAADELRTYMMMLLVAAPVLIDVRVSRSFLEQAQLVGAEMARALGVTARSPKPGTLADARLDDAVQQLRTASTPLRFRCSIRKPRPPSAATNPPDLRTGIDRYRTNRCVGGHTRQKSPLGWYAAG